MIVDGREKQNIDKAVSLLKSGEVVAFPTETVYGLGADAFNESAVKKIFQIKNRPLNDPLILHIGNAIQLENITNDIPHEAQLLIEKFWPGPLTILFKKKKNISDLITSGLDTVAVRMPRNIIALALLKNSQLIIAAPSANKFQSMSPTTAEAVERELSAEVPLILDGGPCLVGLESTIISFEGEPAIVRHGGISVEKIEQVLNKKVGDLQKSKAVAAPGQSDLHYAPKKPVTLIKSVGLSVKDRDIDFTHSAALCFSLKEKDILKRSGFKNIYVLSESGNFDEAGKNYFSTMRTIDELNYSHIYCLELPNTDLGKAINERLRKAVHK